MVPDAPSLSRGVGRNHNDIAGSQVSLPIHLSGEGEAGRKTRLLMVTTIMKWVSVTALLLVVLLRPSTSHQLALDFLVCAGAFMVVLALFFKSRDRGLLERR